MILARARRNLPHSHLAGRLQRAIFFVHRWLGIILALLMTMWALSGIVMMYVSFPQTTELERLGGLERLDFSACCAELRLPDTGAIESASIEMFAGAPVLRWSGAQGGGMIDLENGKASPIDASTAAGVASAWLQSHTGIAPNITVATIARDQWTVSGEFRAQQPLYKATANDPDGTVLYVSGTTGEVVQDTSAHERLWNWLGAIPHWLYFAGLRQNVALWSNVVICAALLGTFLTATGLYIGIRQFGRGGRRIPYRGWAWWHHVFGLVFGLFAFSWVASGLFSMNPWGLMESGGPDRELAALAGRSANADDLQAFVAALRNEAPAKTVSARLSIQHDRAWAILSRQDGSRLRANLTRLVPSPPDNAELMALAARARPGVRIASQQLISEPDAYYYAHHSAITLPAWRVIYAAPGSTRLYFDPRTGELLGKIDADARAYRWWHSGLHRLDFGPLNRRPLWDFVMLPLMIGVSMLFVIGLIIGMKRLFRLG